MTCRCPQLCASIIREGCRRQEIWYEACVSLTRKARLLFFHPHAANPVSPRPSQCRWLCTNCLADQQGVESCSTGLELVQQRALNITFAGVLRFYISVPFYCLRKINFLFPSLTDEWQSELFGWLLLSLYPATGLLKRLRGAVMASTSGSNQQSDKDKIKESRPPRSPPCGWPHALTPSASSSGTDTTKATQGAPLLLGSHLPPHLKWTQECIDIS